MEVGEAVNHVSTPCNQTHSTMPSKGAWLHYVFPCGKLFRGNHSPWLAAADAAEPARMMTMPCLLWR